MFNQPEFALYGVMIVGLFVIPLLDNCKAGYFSCVIHFWLVNVPVFVFAFSTILILPPILGIMGLFDPNYSLFTHFYILAIIYSSLLFMIYKSLPKESQEKYWETYQYSEDDE